MIRSLAPGKVGSSEVKIQTSIGGLLLILICSYSTAWVLAYMAIMGVDFQYLPSYLKLGWIGGGEIPATIQLVAVTAAIFTVTAAIVRIFVRRRRHLD